MATSSICVGFLASLLCSIAYQRCVRQMQLSRTKLWHPTERSSYRCGVSIPGPRMGDTKSDVGRLQRACKYCTSDSLFLSGMQIVKSPLAHAPK